MSVGVEMTSYLGKVVKSLEASERTAYSLMMWGWCSARMYSNSRLTRVFVRSRWMTAFDMYFMATM